MANNQITSELMSLVNRLDERTEMMKDSVEDIRRTIREHYDEVYSTMEKHYTKKAEFDPIRKVVYGFVGFILLSMGGMFVTLVVKNNNLPAETSSHFTGPVKPSFPPAQQLSKD